MTRVRHRDEPGKPCPRPAGVASDRGAASIEHAGMVLLVGIVMSAAVAAPVADIVGPQVAYRLCQAFEKLPGSEGGCTSPALQERIDHLAQDCVVSQTDRSLRISGGVKIVRAERQTTDQIQIDADGSARVVVSEGGGAGVGAPSRPDVAGVDDPGVDWDAQAMLSGDLRYHYNFPNEYGGESAAQEFLNGRRGNIIQEVGETVIPGAQTLNEGLTRAGNGLSNLTRRIIGESDEDRRERLQQQEASTADAVSAAISLSGLASVSGDAGLVQGEAQVDAQLQGVVTTSLNNDGPDAGTSQFQGSLQYNLGAEVELGVPGDPLRDIDDLPPFLNVGGQFGQTGSYQVTYDENGDPSVLEFVVETRTNGGLGLGPDVGGVEGNAGVEAGTVTRERRILDLSDAENRAAFDDFFMTAGFDVNGSTARAAVPRPFHPSSPQLLERLTQAQRLWQRTEEDALVINAEYSMSGSGIGADATRDQGLDVGIAKVGGSRNSATLELTGATVRDNRTGMAEQPLATCEG